jgi:hypothetical protein
MSKLANKIANIEIPVEQDCSKGNKLPIIQIFSRSNLAQEFDLSENVVSEKTRVKVLVGKNNSFQTKASTTRNKGEKTTLLLLLQPNDFSRKITIDNDLRKGDKLAVSLETC